VAELTASGIVRAFLSVATLVSGVLGFLSRDLRWFAAAAAFGTMWTVGDVLVAKVLIPLADFAARLLEGGVDGPPVETRPTVEDTIRLLESHLAGGGPREVQIRAAIRLADLYRAAHHDSARARQVIDLIRERFPDAEELQLKM